MTTGHTMAPNTQRGKPTNQKRSPAGFSLIELLITVAIILIIAAIAIPSYLRSKIAANEASAAQNMRTLITASSVYSTAWGNGYPPALSFLGSAGGAATCDQAGLVDNVIATAPSRQGYVFTYTGLNGSVTSPAGCGSAGFYGYLITAVPLSPGLTGNRSFCADDQGVIHYDFTGQAAGSENSCEDLPAL